MTDFTEKDWLANPVLGPMIERLRELNPGMTVEQAMNLIVEEVAEEMQNGDGTVERKRGS